jgi:hypothetical protein
MKKQNRIHTFALSMMMTGLSVMPVWAFSGQIDSGALDTVTCINHSTGQAVPGTLSGAGFDCSALPMSDGDSIGVVLLGRASGDPVVDPVGCDQPLKEMEPNNNINQGQDLGALEAGGCVTVAGSSSGGFGTDPSNPPPNADEDWYVLNIAQASQPIFTLDVDFFFQVIDLDTGEQVEVNCGAEGCVILGQATRVAVGVAPVETTAYTLQFSDGSANTGLQSLSKSTRGVGQPLR